ncbi:uncharacterized protein LOC112557111 isoform X2 [Pomacea canaliculata]|uniref:uncharacterized protein LOC112557111 isoform X2 n=1 Tax=Pomacea canaliculata TaxID=400727 RepID=UPI000D731C63|nr:uncharacterized protein LOC112557111 isoform X2 [Pomacea canaliculata]
MRLLRFAVVFVGYLVCSSWGAVAQPPPAGTGAVEQTTTLWSMVTGTQNPSIGLLGPAGAVGSGPGPDAITAATGQVATTSVAPPHVAGTTSSLLSAIYPTQPPLGPLDPFGGSGAVTVTPSPGSMGNMMEIWNMINGATATTASNGTGNDVIFPGLTTQQLAGMMTNSGSYYNMTMGNITGSGYPSSYPSSYPSGSGPPLDNTIGTGSGFPGGMGSGFPGGMGSGSPGSYPSVGTTPPPQLPGGMTGNTGFNDLLNGILSTGGSGVIPPPPMGLPGSSNTGMATALALMQQRRLQQQRKQQQQQQQMTNLMTASMIAGGDLKDLMPMMMMMMMTSGAGQQPAGGSMNNILGGGGMMPGANSMLGGRSLASAGSMGLPNMFSGPGVGGATQQLSGTPMDLLSGGSNPMSGLFSSGSGTTGGGGGTGGIDLSWLTGALSSTSGGAAGGQVLG